MQFFYYTPARTFCDWRGQPPDDAAAAHSPSNKFGAAPGSIPSSGAGGPQTTISAEAAGEAVKNGKISTKASRIDKISVAEAEGRTD